MRPHRSQTQDQNSELTSRVKQLEKTLETFMTSSSIATERSNGRMQDLESSLRICREALANGTSLASKQQQAEQVAGAYKKSSADLQWALRVIVTVFIGFLAYVLFKDHAEYGAAVESARDASVAAKDWAGKAEAKYDQMDAVFTAAKNEVSQWKETFQKQYIQLTGEFKAEIEASSTRREELANEMKDLAEKVLAEVETQGQHALQELVERGDRLIKESDSDWSRRRHTNELWNTGWRDYGAHDFEAALDRWQELATWDPNDADALRVCGIALSSIAEGKKGPQAQKYSELACGKFEAALRIAPNMPLANEAMGRELVKQAQRTTGDEADRLYREAWVYYERASGASPRPADALGSWGWDLVQQARTKEGTQADQLYQQSHEKFERAVAADPNETRTLALRGAAFSLEAMTKTGEDATSLYRKAYEDLEKVERGGGDILYATYTTWAELLGVEAKAKSDGKSEELLAQACDMCSKAFSLDPNQWLAIFTWGSILQEWGRQKLLEKKPEDAMRLLDKACSRFEMAAATHRSAACYVRWGNALASKAVSARLRYNRNTEDVQTAWDQAMEKYELAYALDPCDCWCLSEWGRMLYVRGAFNGGKVRERLMREARGKGRSAESLRRGSAAIWLAELEALSRNESECRRWLQVAKESGMLPVGGGGQIPIAERRFGRKQWFRDLPRGPNGQTSN